MCWRVRAPGPFQSALTGDPRPSHPNGPQRPPEPPDSLDTPGPASPPLSSRVTAASTQLNPFHITPGWSESPRGLLLALPDPADFRVPAWVPHFGPPLLRPNLHSAREETEGSERRAGRPMRVVTKSMYCE